MPVAAAIAAIISLIKAIPILDKWAQAFITFYVNSQIDGMARENIEALRKAIDDQDQRDLEKAIGNPDDGEPSHLPGTEIRHTLPGVKP